MGDSNQPTNKLPVLHIIYRREATHAEPLTKWLKDNTHGYLCGEHGADDEELSVHCHILVEGLKVTREALRKTILKCTTQASQYMVLTKCQKTKLPYDRDKLAIYILKGDRHTSKCTSYTDAQIEAWASAWVVYEKTPEEDKRKKENAQYDVLMACRQKMTKINRLIQGEYGEIIADDTVEHCQANWFIMCDALNEARIRTSRNELERCYVTILRQDRTHQSDLFDSISKNIFRTL